MFLPVLPLVWHTDTFHLYVTIQPEPISCSQVVTVAVWVLVLQTFLTVSI